MKTDTTTATKNREEFSFQDIGNILKRYKWSIFIVTLLSAFLTYGYLYFQPSIYNSYAIVKVKPYVKVKPEDFINDTTSTIQTKEVIEEISLLQTFKINDQALQKVNFKVQYFKDQGYKKVEIYKNMPIEIKDINITNQEVIGKIFTLIPSEEGYSIKYFNSYSAKIKHLLSGTEPFSYNDTTIIPYGKSINNKYFNLTIEKKLDFTYPIYFTIHGDRRNIFENIVRAQLEITQLEKDTSLIKISYLDTIPERAELYVNALTDSFIEHSSNIKNKENNKALEYIIKELNATEQELKKSELAMETYQLSKSVIKPSDQALIYIKDLSDLEIQISENNLKKKLILNLMNFVRLNDNLDAIAPSLSKLNDMSTLRLIEKLQESQLTETELSVEYTNEYPKLLSIKKQIQNIRHKIAFNLKTLHSNIDDQNINLLKRKNSYEDDLQKLPAQEKELISIKRDYEVVSSSYNYLLKKKSEIETLQLATFSDYRIIDQAYSSNTSIKPRRLVLLLLSIIIGFILGYILAVIRHNRDRTILGKKDVESLTSLPIYGTIPFYKQKEHQIKVRTEVKSPFSEAFRTLRTNLQFINKESKSTTILITSTIAGEGKTTTSANLASILEMAKYKTVIVNLDLRKPTLHKFFDMKNKIGASSYLNHTASIEDIIQHTAFAHLDIITSGPIPIDPSELILSKRLPQLIHELKERYEYIVIDSAPIGIVTDTKTIMQYSDLNFIIIRESYAKKNFIATLEEMIAKHEFKNVGLLINASKDKGGEYGYGYSYEYKE